VKLAPPVDTIEQFLARGGRVQRLTASWERAACAVNHCCKTC